MRSLIAVSTINVDYLLLYSNAQCRCTKIVLQELLFNDEAKLLLIRTLEDVYDRENVAMACDLCKYMYSTCCTVVVHV